MHECHPLEVPGAAEPRTNEIKQIRCLYAASTVRVSGKMDCKSGCGASRIPRIEGVRRPTEADTHPFSQAFQPRTASIIGFVTILQCPSGVKHPPKARVSPTRGAECCACSGRMTKNAAARDTSMCVRSRPTCPFARVHSLTRRQGSEGVLANKNVK